MVGMRRAFRVAGELEANWLFRFSEDKAMRGPQLDAVLRLLVWLGGMAVSAPVCAGGVSCHGRESVLGPARAVLLMLALAEYLLQGWRAIPLLKIRLGG